MLTKLQQWLGSAVLFLAIWWAMLNKYIPTCCWGIPDWLVQLLPIYCVLTFGLYSIFTIIYRTLTFTNCDGAATDLRKEIDEAKVFLKSKGLVVSSS